MTEQPDRWHERNPDLIPAPPVTVAIHTARCDNPWCAGECDPEGNADALAAAILRIQALARRFIADETRHNSRRHGLEIVAALDDRTDLARLLDAEVVPGA